VETETELTKEEVIEKFKNHYPTLDFVIVNYVERQDWNHLLFCASRTVPNGKINFSLDRVNLKVDKKERDFDEIPFELEALKKVINSINETTLKVLFGENNAKV